MTQRSRAISVECCARCGAWDLSYDEPCLACSYALGRGVYKRRTITATLDPEDAAWLAEREAEADSAERPGDADMDWSRD